MLEIINPRHSEHIEEFALHYTWRKSPGSGFSFACDAQGNRYPKSATDGNYALCLSEVAKGKLGKIVFDGIKDYSRDLMVPAEGKCPCGATVWLEDDNGQGIDCDDCERIYNMSGQELAPREQWEEPYDEDSTQPYNVEFGHTVEEYQ